MQRILALLKRYSNLLLFLIIQGVCFILIVSNNNFHRAAFLNSSNAIAGSLFEMKSGVTQYFSLTKENERLSTENALLKQLLFNKDSITATDWLEVVDTSLQIQFRYLPAVAVNNTTRYEKNHLTLNVGTNQGVDAGRRLGVVGPDGVVGLTRPGASGNYTTVTSILHSRFTLSIEHEPTGQIGSLSWQPEDDRYTATVSGIQNHITVEEGDWVVTSGTAGKFPKGERVGKVSKVERIPGTKDLAIKLRLATDFNSVQNVHVISNLRAIERDTIEQGLEQIVKDLP